MFESLSVAIQPLDLAPLTHPQVSNEWRYRPKGSRVPAALPAVTAYGEPDCHGVTVWIDERSWTAEQLPELVAFLTAVMQRTGGAA